MIRPRLMLVSLLWVAGTLWASSAFAQITYSPPRGPISPWMNMFQKRPGPLDNYNSYVRPSMELQRQVIQQNADSMQNAAGIQALGQQMQSAQKGAQVAPTGVGSVFMDFSHYYPTKGGRAAAARPQQTVRPPSSKYASGRGM
jgi:hypothetical protein